MQHYKDMVLQTYADGREPQRAELAGAYGLEFHYTKKLLAPYISPEKTVVELGCGGGYYGLYFAPRCKRYLGIDLSPVNIDAFQKSISESGLSNVSARVGDATDLSGVPDGTFDVVLCLGPMYHLNRTDRQACMRECRRICKPGGIIALAFINKTGAMAKFGCAVGWDKVLTPEIDHFVLDLGTDDVNTDIFYFTMPEELSADAMEAGLDICTMAGLDFLIFEDTIEKLTAAQREVLFHGLDIMHESPACTGLANHAMLVCRKP